MVSLRRQLAGLLPGEDIGASISNDFRRPARHCHQRAGSGPRDPARQDLCGRQGRQSALGRHQPAGHARSARLRKSAARPPRTSASITASSMATDDRQHRQQCVRVGARDERHALDADASSGRLHRQPQGSLRRFSAALSRSAGWTSSRLLDALERKGLIKTLAQPTLLALSGQTASFLAGGEFPIPVAQDSGASGGSGSARITVEFKPFGVSPGLHAHGAGGRRDQSRRRAGSELARPVRVGPDQRPQHSRPAHPPRQHGDRASRRRGLRDRRSAAERLFDHGPPASAARLHSDHRHALPLQRLPARRDGTGDRRRASSGQADQTGQDLAAHGSREGPERGRPVPQRTNGQGGAP